LIPRLDIEAEIDIDLGAIHPPGRGTVEYPGWLGTQRDYSPEFYDEASWELAEQAIADERDALSKVEQQSTSEQEFDELAFQEFDAEAPLMGYLELGTSGLCIALCAAGFVTAYSCRGHSPEPPGLPQVLLSCDQPRAEALTRLAEKAACGLQNFQSTGLALYAASIADFLELAEAAVAERARFELLPPGPERRPLSGESSP
jgi:hypothetical protein